MPDDDQNDLTTPQETPEAQPETPELPEGEQPQPEPAPEPAPETPDDDPKPQKMPEWQQKRIGELTAQKHAARREAEQERKEKEEYKAALEKALAGEKADRPASLPDDEIDRRATQKLAEQQYNARCNEIYDQGKKGFGDFDTAVQNLNMAGVMTPEFLGVVAGLDDAAKVLYRLGTDPDRAAQIAAMPPMKQAYALAKLETELSKPKALPISAAPRPDYSVGGQGRE